MFPPNRLLLEPVRPEINRCSMGNSRRFLRRSILKGTGIYLNSFSFIYQDKILKHTFMFFNRICSHKSGTVWFSVANKSHEDIFQR